MNVLVLNSGRSSLKFQVIATDVEQMKQDRDDRLGRVEVEGIRGEAILTFQCHVQPPRLLPRRCTIFHRHWIIWFALSHLTGRVYLKLRVWRR
jgi:hypothetical protein